MTKLSWELLKLKFQARILESLEPSEAPAKFVISFTGSSVTAGHDSHFNFSTPVIVGNLMGPAFASMGITLHSRNVALGNNPCTPYDVCVKYFAGVDADIVHWEQTYFCEGQIVEQFIRQSMGMPSKPLVVFSDSNTAKWAKEDCKSGHINRTDPIDAEEQSLLAVDALHLVSEANKQLVSKSWKFMAPYMHAYHGAGIQLFSHRSEEDYACKGPFIPSFQDGAASWHPSVLGHSLRASHHAYFWLRAWSEALSDLRNQTSHRVVGAVQKDVVSRLGRLQAPRGKAQHKSDFPDDATCYTDYEPRPVREASLLSTVISGLASNTSNTTPTNGKGWTYQIYENIVNKELVEKSQQMQYLDYKYLLWGDKSAGGPAEFAGQSEKRGADFHMRDAGDLGLSAERLHACVGERRCICDVQCGGGGVGVQERARGEACIRV
eukprot:CAMPEP_0173311706 /NCGR_PEP_ID=MMETSP1143-20121109/23688_1 /TAXON_ID=483371 /ORGANISM="non described non described, Strain CCMP2298" /LENGTH=435 /DNA_ID=CAMNT_0014253745 /DNA_START=123 /DNA_END=1430 /DNA_ORIENTATION=+